MWYNNYMEQSKKYEYTIVFLMALSLIIGVISPIFGLAGMFAIYGFGKKKSEGLPKDFQLMTTIGLTVLGIYFALSIIFNLKLAIDNMQNSSSVLALIFI